MHEIWGRKILRNILFGIKFSCGKCYLLTTWLVGAFDGIGILAPTSISLSIFLHLNICNRTTEMFQNWIFLQKRFLILPLFTFHCISIFCHSLLCSLISWALLFAERFCSNLETSGRRQPRLDRKCVSPSQWWDL